MENQNKLYVEIKNLFTTWSITTIILMVIIYLLLLRDNVILREEIKDLQNQNKISFKENILMIEGKKESEGQKVIFGDCEFYFNKDKEVYKIKIKN